MSEMSIPDLGRRGVHVRSTSGADTVRLPGIRSAIDSGEPFAKRPCVGLAWLARWRLDPRIMNVLAGNPDVGGGGIVLFRNIGKLIAALPAGHQGRFPAPF